MGFNIIQQDITKVHVDAIVNAANNGLAQGGGVCGAIFEAAGPRELSAACHKIGYCETGHAVITEAFRLNAKYIIHAVGPIWQGGLNGEAELLANCYRDALTLADKYKCKSIAFPLISSGIYGYPKQEALQIASREIQAYLQYKDIDVYLVVFDRATIEISQSIFREVEEYLLKEEQYVDVQYKRTIMEAPYLKEAVYELEINESINFFELDATFQQKLFSWIDEKGLTDPEVYKRANMSRKHFSKIRNNPLYQPSKKTAIALAIALELKRPDVEDLLQSAGYALSNSNRFDLIIRYFIEKNQYNIFEINEVLFKYEQPLLGL